MRHLRWVMWGTAMIPQLLNLFHRNTGAPIVDRIMAAFNMSATAFGNLQSMFFYTYAAMQIPSGILADYMGPRKIVALGFIVSSVGAIIFGWAPSVLVLYLGRFLIALGTSVIFISVLKILIEWFPSHQFAMMTSVTTVLAAGGTLLATTPLALLVTWGGWRLPFEVLGFFGVIASLACWLIIRDHPRDLVLPSPIEIERHQLGATLSPPPLNTENISLGQGLKIVVSNKHTWPPFLIGIGLYGTFLLFASTWGIPYLMQSYNMMRSEAANFLLVATIGSMVGRTTIAYISGKIRRRRLPLIICTLTYLALWLVVTFWNGGKPPVQTLYPLFFLMGYLNGGLVLIFACAKEVNLLSLSGIALGFVNLGSFLTTAILQPLFGRALDLGWQGVMVEGAKVYPVQAYHQGFILICVAAVISLIGAFLTKETRCRNVYGSS